MSSGVANGGGPQQPAWLDSHVRSYMERIDAFDPYPFSIPENHDQYIGLHLNDYLRLATRPEVIEAKTRVLSRTGNGNMASVIYGGASPENGLLRRRIAEVMQAGDVFLTVAGYTANLGLIEALALPGMPIYLDENAHASMWDGAKFSAGEPIALRHNDPGSFAEQVSQYGPGLLCIDGFYSTDGDIAPLEEYLEICEANECVVLLDEAHSFGMVGERGGGLAAARGVADRVHLRTGSFSKALGGHGGFVAGSAELMWFLTHRSRSSVFSSAVLPADSAGHLAALEIAIREPERAKHTLAMAQLLRDLFRERGIDPGQSETQIVPIRFDREEDANRFFGLMRDRGILVSIFVAPGVPEGTGLARFSCYADLTADDVHRVADAAAEAMQALGLLRRPAQAASAR